MLEWSAPGEPSMDIDLTSMQGEFHVFQGQNGDFERQFDLAKAEEWPNLFSFLAQFTGQLAS